MSQQKQKHSHIIFTSDIDEYIDSNTYVAYIKQGIATESELHQDLASKLMFPRYYGKNWDALWDCIRDFHGSNYKKVAIVHESVPLLDDKQAASRYLDILNDAVEECVKRGRMQLLVFFSSDARICGDCVSNAVILIMKDKLSKNISNDCSFTTIKNFLTGYYYQAVWDYFDTDEDVWRHYIEKEAVETIE